MKSSIMFSLVFMSLLSNKIDLKCDIVCKAQTHWWGLVSHNHDPREEDAYRCFNVPVLPSRIDWSFRHVIIVAVFSSLPTCTCPWDLLWRWPAPDGFCTASMQPGSFEQYRRKRVAPAFASDASWPWKRQARSARPRTCRAVAKKINSKHTAKMAFPSNDLTASFKRASFSLLDLYKSNEYGWTNEQWWAEFFRSVPSEGL